MPRQSLRDLAAANNLNIDWNRLNSLSGGGDTAYRQQIWGQLSPLINGGVGSSPLTVRGGGGGGGDNGSAGDGMQEGFYDDKTGTFIGDQRFFGEYSPVVHSGSNAWLSDRGDYNYAIPDLGAVEYDPQFGLMNNQTMVEGSRVNRSFDNMDSLVRTAIGAMATAGLANGMGFNVPGFDPATATGGGFGPMMPPLEAAAPGTFADLGALGASSAPTYTAGNLSLLDAAPLALDTSAGAITPSGAFTAPGTGFTGGPGWTPGSVLRTARNGMTLANIANAITGGNTRNNQNRSGNGGLNVPDFLASLFADNRNNSDLQGFRSFLDDSWRRGDPYSDQRQRDLRSLTELRDDPTGYLDRLPGYRSSQDRGVENAMIRNTVSGHNRGGREGAEIAKYLSEGDFKTLSDREKTLVKWGGGENNPMQLASSAMGAAGIYAGLQGARSTGNAATVASALRSAGLGASTIASIMRIFNNDDDTGSGGNDGEPYDPGWDGSDDPYAIDQRGSPDDDDWMAGMDDFFGNGP